MSPWKDRSSFMLMSMRHDSQCEELTKSDWRHDEACQVAEAGRSDTLLLEHRKCGIYWESAEDVGLSSCFTRYLPRPNVLIDGQMASERRS